MASSEVQTEEEERLCCSICLDYFVQPRTLPCLHTFCHLCLVKCAERIKVNEKFCCPLCRVDTNADTSNITSARIWVTKFLVDYNLASLVKRKRSEKMEEQRQHYLDEHLTFSENEIQNTNQNKEPTQTMDKSYMETAKKSNVESKTKPHWDTEGVNQSNLCIPCLRENALESAVVYCSGCSELLCGDCKKHHSKNKFTSGHKLFDIDDDLSEIQGLDYVIGLTKCQNHQKEEVKYLCKDHDQLCCNECAIVTHRKCQDIVSLEKEIDIASNHARVENDLEKIDRHASALAQHEYDYRAKLAITERCLMDELTCLKVQMDDAYRLVEENIMKQFDFMQTKKKNSVSYQLCNIDRLRSALKLSSEKVSATTKFGQDINRYLMERNMKTEMGNHMKTLRELHQSANTLETHLAGKAHVADNLTKFIMKGFELQEHRTGKQLPVFPCLETTRNEKKGFEKIAKKPPWYMNQDTTGDAYKAVGISARNITSPMNPFSQNIKR